MSLAAIVFACLLVAGAIAYARYRLTPARLWKGRVFAHIRALQIRRQVLRDSVIQVDSALARLADEAFARHLRTIPVDTLGECPGIGTVTVSRLRAAGYRSLADVMHTRFAVVPDVRPAQANALHAGLERLLADAQSQFEAGASPEAQEFRRQVDAMRATDLAEAVRRAQELDAVELALHDTFDVFHFAREVTFLRFLFRQDVGRSIAEVMGRPLPTPKEPDRASPPAQAGPPAPPAPPVPQTAVAVAAKPTSAPFPLPSGPPTLPVPPPPADLFRAALNEVARPAGTTTTEHPGLARMRAVVALGLVVARADGRVAQSERKAIRAFLEQCFGHDPVLVRNIDPLMERIEKLAPDEATALAEVRTAVPVAELSAVYQWAGRVADASGERNQKERDVLARIAAALGLDVKSTPGPSPVPVSEQAQKATSDSPEGKGRGASPVVDHRAVLDIAPDVPLDPDLIRRRYQLLTEKLDPLKAAALGPEFARMAEEKREQVRAAAEVLIAPFNEPLEKAAAPPPTDLRHNPDLDDVFGA